LGQAYAQRLNAAEESERNRLKSEQKAWIEPYRFCRRLRLLRDWSHDEIDEVFS
jgi:uncharacterized protein YecT (DUF1311 family)